MILAEPNRRVEITHAQRQQLRRIPSDRSFVAHPWRLNRGAGPYHQNDVTIAKLPLNLRSETGATVEVAVPPDIVLPTALQPSREPLNDARILSGIAQE
jgi:hypothetical protein